MSVPPAVETDRSCPSQGNAGKWIAATGSLVLLTEQTALGLSLISPALGAFAAKYNTTQISWMITIFLLVGAVLTPVLGKLGDRVGKQKVLVATAFAGVVGSVICALAPNYGIMLLGRALVGASGTFVPLAFSLMRDVFPKRHRSLSIGIATNGAGVVTILGPFLAGFIIDQIAPEAIFWFSAALSLLGAIGTILFVPETPIRNRSAFDVPGIIGLAVGLLALMYGLTNISTWHLLSGRTLTYVGGGAVILLAWWMWERRAAAPFLDTRIMASRPVATVVLSSSLIVSTTMLATSYLPTMLQTSRSLGGDYGFGLDATGVAVYCIAGGITTVLAGVVVGIGSKRYGLRPFLLLSGVFAAAGTLTLALLRTEPWMPIIGFALVGAASMSMAAGAALIMELAPAKSRGVSAGIQFAVQGTLGSAIIQTGGLILAGHVKAIAPTGAPVYSSTGWILAIGALGTLIALAGIAIAALIPKQPKEAEAATETNELVTQSQAVF
ncbi:MFS transporter [Streptomyces sp. NPDC052013]|uniref:MFS transporter n=1 Tax=Streptomyces sp. NPDC052013 TaxID=3365679 RepID=UPI0037D41B24